MGKLRDIIEGHEFKNDAAIITLFSILIETSAHVWLTIPATWCYTLFFDHPKFCMWAIQMMAWSDTAGVAGGMLFGKSHFAKSISPNKTFEGVTAAVLFPATVIATIFYYLGQYSEG